MNETVDVKNVVRQRYGAAAERVAQGRGNACCGGSAASPEQWDPITANLYDQAQAADVPAAAMLASLGCGNPTALAELKAGETVLDLGSGGGIDVLLSAKRVGPTGTAYGLDMTDPMLALAQENKRKSGLANVHFLKGEIEHIPLPSDSVDVIISNCVINLSPDKKAVFGEALRVLRPGGYLLTEFYNTLSLRYLIKRLKRPTAISESVNDEAVYTRYDSLDRVRSYLPSDVHVQTVHGIRVVTPFSQAHRWPVVGKALRVVERQAAVMPGVRRLGGFMLVVAKKQG